MNTNNQWKNEDCGEEESERILNKIVESIEKRLTKAIPLQWIEMMDCKVEFKGVSAGDGGGLKFEVLCNYDESAFKLSNRPSIFAEGYRLVDDVPVSEDGPEQLWVKLYRVVGRNSAGHNEPPKESDKENDQCKNEGFESDEEIQEDEWKFTGHGKSLGAFPQVTPVPLDAEGVERTQNELYYAIRAFLHHDRARTHAREAIVRYSCRLDEIPQKLQYMTDLVLRL